MAEAGDVIELPPTRDVVDTLVANHRQFLSFLERRVGSRAVAEDILQDAFVRGLDKLDSVREGESIVAWFYRLLRNAVVDHYRRNAARGRALDTFAGRMDSDVEPEPELRGAICRCVAELARTLKPEYAAILQQVEIEGVAVKDYATQAGITTSNAAVRVFRAREALRKRVARSCGTCAEHGCLDCTCGSGACGDSRGHGH